MVSKFCLQDYGVDRWPGELGVIVRNKWCCQHVRRLADAHPVDTAPMPDPRTKFHSKHPHFPSVRFIFRLEALSMISA